MSKRALTISFPMCTHASSRRLGGDLRRTQLLHGFRSSNETVTLHPLFLSRTVSGGHNVKRRLAQLNQNRAYGRLCTRIHPFRRPMNQLRKSGSHQHRSYSGDRKYDSSWSRWKPDIVVGSIVAICCGGWLYHLRASRLSSQGNHRPMIFLKENFILSEENIRRGRWWVMLTSTFAHEQPLHLAINMISLWSLGRVLFMYRGVPQFLGLFVVSGVASSAASLYWQRVRERLRKELSAPSWYRKGEIRILGLPVNDTTARTIAGHDPHSHAYGRGSIGASGSICGVSAALTCLSPHTKVVLLIVPMPLWMATTVFGAGSVFCLGAGALPGIDHAGHLGGMGAGTAYYFTLMRVLLRRG